jgi:hypothetical protein
VRNVPGTGQRPHLGAVDGLCQALLLGHHLLRAGAESDVLDEVTGSSLGFATLDQLEHGADGLADLRNYGVVGRE